MTQKSRELSAHQAVAVLVKRLRQNRGWSAQRLGEEMTRAGAAWDRSIVANFENGRRPYITVEELLALAAVLEVAPVDLVVPKELTGEPYQVTPTLSASADTVREWIRGENVLVKAEPGRIGNEAISVSAPVAQIMRFVESMPDERGKAVMRRLVLAEQREWQRDEIRAGRLGQEDDDASR